MKLSWHQGVIAKVEHKTCNPIEVITKICPKGFILGVKVKIRNCIVFFTIWLFNGPKALKQYLSIERR
jgi:hypothetical protein